MTEAKDFHVAHRFTVDRCNYFPPESGNNMSVKYVPREKLLLKSSTMTLHDRTSQSLSYKSSAKNFYLKLRNVYL